MNSKKNSSSNKGEPISPCKLCPKNMTDNDNVILCDLCQTRVHIKCNHLNYMNYKYLQGCNEPWYCLSCINKQALAYKKQELATITRLIKKFRCYRCVKSHTPPIK